MLEDSKPELDKCDHTSHSDIHFSSPIEHEKINFESYTPISIFPHDSNFDYSRINPIDQEHSLTHPNFIWDHEFFIIPSYLHDSWNPGSSKINIGYQLDPSNSFHGQIPQMNSYQHESNCKNYHLDLGDECHITDDVMTVDSTFPFDPGGVSCMSG